MTKMTPAWRRLRGTVASESRSTPAREVPRGELPRHHEKPAVDTAKPADGVTEEEKEEVEEEEEEEAVNIEEEEEEVRRTMKWR